MPGRRNLWLLADIETFFQGQRDRLAKSAVSNPDDIPPAQVGDALQRLGARVASEAEGRKIDPADIVAVSRVVNDDERKAIAAAADETAQQLGADILDRLKSMHMIEALVLVQAVLPQLRTVAGRVSEGLGVPVAMSDVEWHETALRLLDKVIHGEPLPVSTPPREAAEALADAGVLRRREP